MKYQYFLHLALISLLSLLSVSCSKEQDDEVTTVDENQHESVLLPNSGWQSLAFDDVIFYPFGGFSGYKQINLTNPFVYMGQPRAISLFTYDGNSFTKEIVAANENEVIRYPLRNSDNHFVNDGNIYEYWFTDNDEAHLRRYNAPDYSTYNTFEWGFRDIKSLLSKEGYTLGGINVIGNFGISAVNNSPKAVNCLFVNLIGQGETSSKEHLVMTSKNISSFGGSVEQISVVPYESSLQSEFYLNVKSQAINSEVMTVAVGSENRTTYFILGSFDTGFRYIKQLSGYRTIDAFFAGKENFFCVLVEDGGSKKFGFKIDLEGNVTELGEVTGAYQTGYTHYKGELTVAINEGVGTETPVYSVKQFTASGVNNLGAANLTEKTTIDVIMSDGDELFGASINNSSPKYFSGGRQFYGWEFYKYEGEK